MNLREWREAEGLTQHAAAEKCDTSPRTWEAWEVGRNLPRADVALRIIKKSRGKVTLEGIVEGGAA